MATRDRLPIDLALQGGGAHGAFTWGVLDRLLEEDDLAIEGVSGTSAGAMNAAILTCGYARGGREGARADLEAFWKQVSDAARFSPFQRSPLDIILGRWTLDHSPLFIAMDMMARVVSPYQMNPRGVNPLSDILRDAIDLDAVAKSPIKLFVTATSVRTGKGRVFRNDDLTVDALLASACLPSLFQAVEIEGEPYWDGGYSGNPTMTPLIRECESRDTILVQINPIERLETPRSAREILSRLNEVSFNAVLLKELRMMALLRKLALQGAATQNISNFADPEIERWAHMRVHRIAADSMTELGYSSKLNAEWAFLTMLRDKGRETADAFLAAHRGDLGERSTLDIDSLLEGI